MYKFCQDDFEITDHYEYQPAKNISKFLNTFQLSILQACFAGEVILYIKIIYNLRKNDEYMRKWLSKNIINERHRYCFSVY